MGLSRLSEECRACPFVGTCKQKRMEALAYMQPPNISESAAYPVVNDVHENIAVKHSYRDVKIAEGMTVTIDLEDIKRQMRDELYNSLRLMPLV